MYTLSIFEFVNDMSELNSINKAMINKVAKNVLKKPTIHILTSKEE